MFYVLNFRTHTFTSCDTLEKVKDTVRGLFIGEDAVDESEVEIINACIDYSRFSVEEFYKEF